LGVLQDGFHNRPFLFSTPFLTDFQLLCNSLLRLVQDLSYGSRDAYLEAHATIAAKAQDIVSHYLEWIFPNGYKAQVVATSREAAVRYKGLPT